MTGNPLELFRKLFGAVRAIFWALALWGSFVAPNVDFSSVQTRLLLCWRKVPVQGWKCAINTLSCINVSGGCQGVS